jgi:hypothetical protein
MRVIAQFQVASELAPSRAGEEYSLRHPAGVFELKLKAGAHAASEVPWLLATISYDAPNLDAAYDIGVDHLMGALDMVALVTNARFEIRRVLHLADATPNLPQRDCRIFKQRDPSEVPLPRLSQPLFAAAELLVGMDLPTRVQEAVHWFRIALLSRSPEEKFKYFWFALEIVAEVLKNPARVPDACPQCRAPLFCRNCDTQPTHRPYPKQAVREIALRIMGDSNAAAFDGLERTRHGLLHGSSLAKVAEANGTDPAVLVEQMGGLAWLALREAVRDAVPQVAELTVLPPRGYSGGMLIGAAHVSTALPLLPDGTPDVAPLAGINMEIEIRVR